MTTDPAARPPAPVAVRSKPRGGQTRNRIFISYRRDDSAPSAGRVNDRLIAHFGRAAVYKDVDSTPYGEHFPSYITGVIAQCSVLLAIIGPQWLDAAQQDGSRRLDNPKDLVRLEIETALASGVRVIPVLVHNAPVPLASDLPESLRDLVQLNSLAVRDDPDFNVDVQRLERTLEQWVPPRFGRLGLLGQLKRHRFAVGLIFSAILIMGALWLLNVSGYHDDVQYATAFLGWPVLAVAGVLALLLLAGALMLQRANTSIGRALSAILLAVVVALPFASPRLTSDCGTLSCPTAAPADQQVLHVGLPAYLHPPTTLDPQFAAFSLEQELDQLIFPGLVQSDDQLRVVPWAASHWTISPDGTVYRFTLRQGLMWSTGVPITASDFAFALNRALSPCTQAVAASLLYAIADGTTFNNEACVHGRPSGTIATLIGRSLQVLDDQTLVIHLQGPAAYFLDALTAAVAWAVPQALVDTYGATWTSHLTDASGLGGDLFKVTAWQPGKELVLQRNDRFWGSQPKLREIDFTVGSSDKATYAAYLAGTGDISPISTDQYTSVRQRSDFHEVVQLLNFYLQPDWSVPPFNDLRMRQAFALALNKTQLVRDVFSGTSAPTNHIVPPGMPGFNPGLQGPDSTQSLTGNMAHAQALAQAYASDHCGGSLSRCPRVVFAVYSLTPGQEDFALLATEARDMWLQAMPGYPITIKPMTLSDLYSQAGNGTFQIWTHAWVVGFPDPWGWLSVPFLPGSPFNFGHVNLPDANVLMRAGDVDQNLSRRLSEYQQAEQLLVTDVAWIPCALLKVFYVQRPYVINYHVTAEGWPSSNTWQQVYIAQH
jgi:peptide/nickel transport system substrate-binding protein/oligopeptide transport system substrate-binding protein